MVKDFLIDRLKEIQTVKKEVKSKIRNAHESLHDREDKVFSCGRDNDSLYQKIDLEDITFGREIIKDISNAASHAETGLATISFLAEHIFSGFLISEERKKQEGYNYPSMNKAFYYTFIHHNLSIMDYYTSVPIEIPTSVSVRSEDSARNLATPFISQRGSGTFVGLRQGAHFSPFEHHCVEYLYRIVNFEVEFDNFIKNIYYFVAIGSNDAAYLWFINNRTYAPLKISFDGYFSETQFLHLVGVEVRTIVNKEGSKDTVRLYYSNLDVFSKISTLPFEENVESLLKDFFKCLVVVKVHECLNTMTVEVDFEELKRVFRQNKGEVIFNAYKASGKKILSFFVDSLKTSSVNDFCHAMLFCIRSRFVK